MSLLFAEDKEIVTMAMHLLPLTKMSTNISRRSIKVLSTVYVNVCVQICYKQLVRLCSH